MHVGFYIIIFHFIPSLRKKKQRRNILNYSIINNKINSHGWKQYIYIKQSFPAVCKTVCTRSFTNIFSFSYIYIKKHIIKQNIPRTKRIEIEATLAFRKKWRRANDRQGRSRDRCAPAEPARIPAESASLNTCTASSSLVNRTSIVVTRALMSSIPLQFSDERQRYTTTRYGIPSPSLHSSHRVLYRIHRSPESVQ